MFLQLYNPHDLSGNCLFFLFFCDLLLFVLLPTCPGSDDCISNSRTSRSPWKLDVMFSWFIVAQHTFHTYHTTNARRLKQHMHTITSYFTMTHLTIITIFFGRTILYEYILHMAELSDQQYLLHFGCQDVIKMSISKV